MTLEEIIHRDMSCTRYFNVIVYMNKPASKVEYTESHCGGHASMEGAIACAEATVSGIKLIADMQTKADSRVSVHYVIMKTDTVLVEVTELDAPSKPQHEPEVRKNK